MNIDTTLLRKQRDWLLAQEGNEAEGLVNLCDYLLDVAEGHEPPRAVCGHNDEYVNADGAVECADCGYVAPEDAYIVMGDDDSGYRIERGGGIVDAGWSTHRAAQACADVLNRVCEGKI